MEQPPHPRTQAAPRLPRSLSSNCPDRCLGECRWCIPSLAEDHPFHAQGRAFYVKTAAFPLPWLRCQSGSIPGEKVLLGAASTAAHTPAARREKRHFPRPGLSGITPRGDREVLSPPAWQGSRRPRVGLGGEF